jgi:hypothetical protein
MPLYVYLNGGKRGPFPEEELRRLVREGILHESDLAASQLDGEWKPLSGLISGPPTAVPTAPTPTGPPAEELRVSHDSLGAYASATVDQNETVFYKTSVHWIIFLRYAVLALLVFFFVAIPFGIAVQAFTASHLGWFALPLPMLILIPPAVLYSSSELIVTNRRVLIKTGAIHRQTLEMFVSKVESVGVDQSFLGRMLNYGTVIIRGTGGSEEPFQTIAHPIEFRNCVQRLQSGAEPDIRQGE